MNPGRKILLALLVLTGRWTFFVDPCRAGAGKDGFTFLTMTEGPRAASMGGAGAALADDAPASLDNPAALGVLRVDEAQMAYASLPASMSYGSLAYAHPFSASAMALHAHVLRYGDIKPL